VLHNYLLIAFRNLIRHKLHAAINLLGLSLGIACCLLMGLYVQIEWSHDRFHENRDRIFRLVTREVRPNGRLGHRVLFNHEVADALEADLPAVEEATAFHRSDARIRFEDATFRERIGLVSPDFLSIFSFPLLAGDPATALDHPDAVVITQDLARKLFGSPGPDYSNAIGQTLTFPDNELTPVVTGVLAPVPAVSSLQFAALVRIDHNHHRQFGRSVVDGGHASIYLRLVEGQTWKEAQELATTLNTFALKHMGKRIQRLVKWQRIPDASDAFSLFLQPLLDVYWNSAVYSYYESSGSLTAVYILWGLAVVVLLIACTNFVTISVAGSVRRAVEVGMRKALGADRRQVMLQFWCEAVLLAVLGLVLGLALAEVFLPAFNGLVQRNLDIAFTTNVWFLLMLLAVVVVVGLLAGSYPSLLLSRFQPVESLKGGVRIGGRSRLTRALIVLQYGASIALLACTGVVLQQQRYLRDKALGYDQEAVVVIRGVRDEDLAGRFRQEVLKHAHVAGATVSDRAFTTGSSGTDCESRDGTSVFVRMLCVDADYLPVLGIPVVQGRNFEDAHPSDKSEAVLVNERLVRSMGLTDPVGKPLNGFKYADLKNPTIVGVVRDFHIDSLHRRIQPLVLQMRYHTNWPCILIRLRPGNVAEAVAALKDTWTRVVPDTRIRLSFLDENLNRQYAKEERWQRVLTYASAFGVAISCLGLLGLASLAVAQRTKELGIRKALGASVQDLVGLLSMDFVKLLLVANVCSWPAAYWAMSRWLDNFAYRIDLGPTAFLLAGVLALAIALATVSLQTFGAARRNPAEALLYE